MSCSVSAATSSGARPVAAISKIMYVCRSELCRNSCRRLGGMSRQDARADVAVLVRTAQPQRRGGQFVAHVRAAFPVAWERQLVGKPPFEIPRAPARAGVPFQVAQPPVAVPEAQHQLQLNAGRSGQIRHITASAISAASSGSAVRRN